MLPIKKLLCPTDFSDASLEALDVAMSFARHFGAELLVVHVVAPVPTVAAPTDPVAFDVGAYQQGLGDASERQLRELLEKRVPEGVTYRGVVVQGDAAHEVIRTAEEENVDLIVTATRGASTWRVFVFGSVAERIVRGAPCPVLTIPP